MLKKCAMLAVLVTMLAPGAASADWLFTPNIGPVFGGSASGREHLSYGASIGWMGAGVFGWEADFAYTPEFFEGDDDDVELFDSSNVTTFMVNAIIGIPAGGTSGAGFRPYFSGGAGLMHVDAFGKFGVFEHNRTLPALSLGGGVTGFLTPTVGLSWDVRRLSTLRGEGETLGNSLGREQLSFWRATMAVALRY